MKHSTSFFITVTTASFKYEKDYVNVNLVNALF